MAIINFKKEFRYTYTFGFSFYKEFLWNTGDLSSYWYQVVGCCKDTFEADGSTVCPPFKTDDSACENKKSLYFQTLLAKNVEDLCQQITNNNWNWELCSIKKWSKPAENIYVDSTNDCNILQEVDFKDIPECISLSVSQKPSINIRFNMSVTPYYYGSGKLSICKNGCSASYCCCCCPCCERSCSQGCCDSNTDSDHSCCQQEIQNLVFHKEKEIIQDEKNNSNFIKTQSIETIPDDDYQSLNQLSSTIADVIVNCSQCTTVSSRLYCKNNLLNLNYFSDFIYNNKKEVFDSNFEIKYSKYSDSWKANYLYDQNISNSPIKWNIYFDLACFSSTETNYYWKFLMLFRKTENNTPSETKLAITVPSEFVCGYNSEFNFSFNFNVVKKQLFTNINYFRDDFVFYDKIGLFSNNYWKKNPEFYIKITQNYDGNLTTRKIITY